MATGPRECKTYVLSASYRQDNHAPAVLPAVVLGGDEDDALGAATTASCAACIYIDLYSATQTWQSSNQRLEQPLRKPRIKHSTQT